MDLDASQLPLHHGAPAQGGTAKGLDTCGLTIQDYAAKFEVQPAEVWRKLRRGELIGRTERGRLIIYPTPGEAPMPAAAGADSGPSVGLGGDVPRPRTAEGRAWARADAEADLATGEATLPPDFVLDLGEDTAPGTGEAPDLSFLPPLPPGSPGRSGASAEADVQALALARSGSTELALLLDHLSLAKDENREILRMTTESIRKVSELSDTIVEMKDTVIDAKEAEILALREQLAAREVEVLRLRQVNEDLEMLARTMVTESNERR